MTSRKHELMALRDILREFSAARGWDKFHAPKNLAMALIVEAAELVEHFQWMTAEESGNLAPEKHSAVQEEVADVLIYLIEMADALDIDLIAAAREKIARNALKYPANCSDARNSHELAVSRLESTGRND